VCRDLVLDALCFDRRTTGRARTARAISSRGAVVAGPSPQPTPTKRAQDFRATLRVPVADPSDLSTATQKALRTTRWLGGYVVTVQYGTPAPSEGTANLRVRTPVSRVQAAIVQFNNLGQILEQQTQVTISSNGSTSSRARSAEPRGTRPGSPPPRHERTELNRRAAFATLAVDLTTHEPEKKAASPGPLERAVDDATGLPTAELALAPTR
jgi:hypothetical protein